MLTHKSLSYYKADSMYFILILELELLTEYAKLPSLGDSVIGYFVFILKPESKTLRDRSTREESVVTLDLSQKVQK